MLRFAIRIGLAPAEVNGRVTCSPSASVLIERAASLRPCSLHEDVAVTSCAAASVAHPMDEHVFVVQGTWWFGMGSRFDASTLRPVALGAFTLGPKNMPHFAWSKTETTIHVYGIGPFATRLSYGSIWSSANERTIRPACDPTTVFVQV